MADTLPCDRDVVARLDVREVNGVRATEGVHLNSIRSHPGSRVSSLDLEFGRVDRSGDKGRMRAELCVQRREGGDPEKSVGGDSETLKADESQVEPDGAPLYPPAHAARPRTRGRQRAKLAYAHLRTRDESVGARPCGYHSQPAKLTRPRATHDPSHLLA